ncbi:hypothetical protein PS2_037301 [Malus domestica]
MVAILESPAFPSLSSSSSSSSKVKIDKSSPPIGSVWSIELNCITPCRGNSHVLAHWLLFFIHLDSCVL